ncbi:HupE/UreJ family protein [Tumebacillus sp. DT12]|uniref:HupE/UreJ family protein n=1 Tax=Tumebacillus lacus TaxID=2995335 RepID=A0ABT3X2M3_9BACL|nr:HupE/UreJ family protein [Tumebacillus lacus]MCX7571157.1 HupE/UreJ family protein [Tumebacillus lacus]
MNQIFRMFLCLFVCLALLLPLPASAHDNSPGYSDILIEPNRVMMTVFLEQIFLLDVAKTPWNGDPFTEAYLAEHKEKMVPAVAAKLIVEANGVRLQPQPEGLKLTNRNGVELVQFDYAFPSESAIKSIAITNDLYVRNNKHTHTNFANIRMGEKTTTFIFQEEERTFRLGEVGELKTAEEVFSAGAIVKQFLKLGVEHILTGYDHLLFLLALLLVVRRFKDIAIIVTSFTAAHSITLLLAAFGAVTLPSLFVEAMIAASICYVAAENLFRSDYKYRWLLTFAFGLIHGFGFAGVLAETALPQGRMVLSLLMFNLGVEAGQLAIVLLVLPILFYLSRRSWHAAFVRVGSGLIFLLGLFWLIQRIFLV